MARELSDEQWEQVEQLLFEGHRVKAMKLFSELSDTTLIESYEVIESHEKLLREDYPEKFKRSEPRGCLGLLGVLTLAAGGATWWATHWP